MKRSEFLKLSIGALGLLVAGPTNVLLSSFVPQFEGSVKRVVKIKFPAGKTFADFQADQARWMNSSSWLNLLSEAKQNGHLSDMQKEVHPDHVQYTYVFSSIREHDNFVKSSRLLSEYNEHEKEKLGYVSELEIVSLKA